MTASVARYGPWAVVAGASEGLGAAFASALAARGHHLILLARREALLTTLAEELKGKHGVEARCIAADLANPAFAERLRAATADLDVGIGVYNAAYSFIAPLLERPAAEALQVVDVNCRGPLLFTHALAPGMIARGRGGLVLMASIAGLFGSAKIQTYAASKAFNIVLANGLWAELRPKGVDVLASCAGAIRTPNYLRTTKREAPGTLDASVVAESTLDRLGRGPLYIPGGVNKLASFMLGRVMSRRRAVTIMSNASADLT